MSQYQDAGPATLPIDEGESESDSEVLLVTPAEVQANKEARNKEVREALQEAWDALADGVAGSVQEQILHIKDKVEVALGISAGTPFFQPLLDLQAKLEAIAEKKTYPSSFEEWVGEQACEDAREFLLLFQEKPKGAGRRIAELAGQAASLMQQLDLL